MNYKLKYGSSMEWNRKAIEFFKTIDMQYLIKLSFFLISFFIFSLNASGQDSTNYSIIGNTNLFDSELKIDTLALFTNRDSIEYIYHIETEGLKKLIYYNKFLNFYKILISEMFVNNTSKRDWSTYFGKPQDVYFNDNYFSYTILRHTSLEYILYNKDLHDNKNYELAYRSTITYSFGAYYHYKMIDYDLIFVSPPLIEHPQTIYCVENPVKCDTLFSKESFIIEFSPQGEKNLYEFVNVNQKIIIKEHIARTILNSEFILVEKRNDKYFLNVGYDESYEDYTKPEYRLIKAE